MFDLDLKPGGSISLGVIQINDATGIWVDMELLVDPTGQSRPLFAFRFCRTGQSGGQSKPGEAEIVFPVDKLGEFLAPLLSGYLLAMGKIK